MIGLSVGFIRTCGLRQLGSGDGVGAVKVTVSSDERGNAAQKGLDVLQAGFAEAFIPEPLQNLGAMHGPE